MKKTLYLKRSLDLKKVGTAYEYTISKAVNTLIKKVGDNLSEKDIQHFIANTDINVIII